MNEHGSNQLVLLVFLSLCLLVGDGDLGRERGGTRMLGKIRENEKVVVVDGVSLLHTYFLGVVEEYWRYHSRDVSYK